MQDFATVMGIIIRSEPIGEFDRRMVILTKERGKISVFAKGARKQTNRFLATTNPFCFGEFKLFSGRNSYSLADAEIRNFFEELRMDYQAAYYGMYFLEIADYYARENNDERQLLKLLYQSLKALCIKQVSHIFVRTVFEIKSIMINGEFPGIELNEETLAGTAMAVEHLWKCLPENVYSFKVSEAVLLQLRMVAKNAQQKVMDREFHASVMLSMIENEEQGFAECEKENIQGINENEEKK